MASIELPLVPTRVHDRLIVLLPGLSDHADIFFKYGFEQDLRQAGVQADLRFVDTRVRYYTEREIVERLRREILEPARVSGYREIWIVGVSVGGFAALETAREHPHLVDGIVVFSPFLGRMAKTMEIRRAGGLEAWTPPPTEDRDFTLRLWAWLQGYTRDDAGLPPLFLAYGAYENDFYWGYSLLAEVLPHDRVERYEGIHGWRSWKPMWPGIIAQVWGGQSEPDPGESVLATSR